MPISIAPSSIPAIAAGNEGPTSSMEPMNYDVMLNDINDITTEKRAPREIKRTNVKLLDVLGKGNFGEVRKGLLSEMPGIPGYLVAVKALHSALDSDRKAALQEAVIMAQFNNPFVVGLHGVVTIGEPLLVVIEYCEYGLQSIVMFRLANFELNYDVNNLTLLSAIL